MSSQTIGPVAAAVTAGTWLPCNPLTATPGVVLQVVVSGGDVSGTFQLTALPLSLGEAWTHGTWSAGGGGRTVAVTAFSGPLTGARVAIASVSGSARVTVGVLTSGF